jgi:ribose transport system substrate-binding protein
MEQRLYTIGFANMDEKNAFPIAIRESLEKAARDYPEVRLIARNNDQDTERAIANAHEFASLPVDLAIIFHSDSRASHTVVAPLQAHDIPIIAVELPLPFSIFFGYNNRQAAEIGGDALADWIRVNWGGQVDKLLNLTSSRLLGDIHYRFSRAIERLTQVVTIDPDDILYLESDIDRVVAYERTTSVLQRWEDYHRIVIIALNDFVAMGALEAARQLGREQDIALLSYDGTEFAIHELNNPASRLIASPASFPERYGERLIPLALQMLRGEHTSPMHFVETNLLARKTT